MRILLAAIAMLLSVATARIALSDEASLRIGVQNQRVPFSFTDAEGDLQGFDVEIAWALCVRIEAQCAILPLEFTALISGLQEGRIDVAVASMSITEERLQLVDFTEKYYQAANRFVARPGTLADVSLENLNGKVIGVKRGTTHDRYLSNAYADGPSIRRYSNSDEIYLDLALGRLDLVLGDAISLTESLLKTDLGAELDFIGPALSDPEWFGHGEGIAVRKGNVELLARLNRALRQLLADGTYAEIQDQYFDYDIYGDPAGAVSRPE